MINGQAVAFVGPSGSGKSGHALMSMARGAQLLADDITWLEHSSHGLIALCPATIAGQIEARGIGILNAPAHDPVPLALIVDLSIVETVRLPEPRLVTLLGHDIAVVHRTDSPSFVDAIMHYMMHGNAD
ncbi:serine/threonine protein kinase [Octadecabacter sp.]|nr:serine/threonine protein kinase [Octadecabacter sp.]